MTAFRVGLRSALFGTAALALAAGAQAASRQMTFVAWGGSTQEVEYNAWAPALEKQGIKVVQDGPTDYGKIKAMVESGNVTWDVVDVEADWALAAYRDGLLETIDPGLDFKGVNPKFVKPFGVASFDYSYVLAYNTDKLGKTPPKGWDSFFDAKTYPGKRGMIGWSTGGVLEMALLADGVPADKLYPLDIDRAFKKLDTIKSQLVFWNSGAQSQQWLASGEMSMCFCWSARAQFLRKDGAPVEIQWNQNLATVDYLVIPKGSKNKDIAQTFMTVAASAEGSAKMSQGILDRPVNAGSKALIPADVWAKLAAGDSSLVDIQQEFWRDHGKEIAARWEKWKVN